MSPQMLKGALDVILEAIKLLDSDRSPGSEKGEKRANEPGPVQLDPAVQAGLTEFSLVSPSLHSSMSLRNVKYEGIVISGKKLMNF